MDQILSLPDRVKAALEKHPDSMDLKLAAAGWNDARRALAEEKSSSALKNLEAFERRLQSLLDALGAATPAPAAQEWRWCEEARDYPDPIAGMSACVRYLKAMGWTQANTSTFDRDVKSGKIPMSCPDGWHQKHLNDYARLKKWPPRAGSPALTYDPAREPSYAERVGLRPGQDDEERGSMAYEAARTRKMVAEAEATERKNREAEGKLVDILLVENEQREWAHAVRMHLSPMVRSTAERVLDLIGGERATALEIIALVGGDESMADELIAWVAARKQDVVAMYKPYLAAALDAFARTSWFTPEMAKAWKLYQDHRLDSERADMAALIRAAGGDPARADSLLEQFAVRALDA